MSTECLKDTSVVSEVINGPTGDKYAHLKILWKVLDPARSTDLNDPGIRERVSYVLIPGNRPERPIAYHSL
jgi:hypothetical protein|tara:strand:+ start:1009 stop:1221 length:213 start_codon:yes stop_codon:yes gene_type:complete